MTQETDAASRAHGMCVTKTYSVKTNLRLLDQGRRPFHPAYGQRGGDGSRSSRQVSDKARRMKDFWYFFCKPLADPSHSLARLMHRPHVL